MNNQHTNAANPGEVIEQITAERLDAIIAEGRFTMIDVRDAAGIESQGAVPGAVNIPLDTITDAVNDPNDDHYEVFRSKGPFLFICTGGVMSYMAALKAQENGIRNIFNLEGGHSAWQKMKEAETILSPA